MLKTGRKGFSTEEKNQIISKIYYSPKGYVGEHLLFDVIKREGYAHMIGRKDIRKWLNNEITRQKQRMPIHVKQYAQFITAGGNDQHMMDLVVMPSDRGFTHMLTYIDIYSRYAVCVPIRKRDAETVVRVLQKITTSGSSVLKKPRLITTDSGTEFTNKKVAEFMEINNIRHKIIPPGDHRKLSIIERFHKTITNSLFKKMYRIEEQRRIQIRSEKGRKPTRAEEADVILSTAWVLELNRFVEAYNKRIHTTLGCSPYEAITRVETPIEREKIIFDPKIESIHTLGDKVKLMLPRSVQGLYGEPGKTHWARETDYKWTDDYYTIVAVHVENDHRPRMYSVARGGDKLKRYFYYEELQLFDPVEYIKRIQEDYKKFDMTEFVEEFLQ